MDNSIFYSIIIVCLNSGERLQETVESVLRQTCSRYEVIVKDGGSTDGSLEWIEKQAKEPKSQIALYQTPDSGIYDAMNQAVTYAKGEYLLFLNTGDTLYDETVLDKITQGILKNKNENGSRPDIVYGNLYHKALQTTICPAPKINDFACYRNVPCHQSCFYRRELFAQRGYEPRYHVRADYEHFLWCYYEYKAQIHYLPVMTASYEGGGYSETKENLRASAKQHKEIVVRYMGRKKAWKYRCILLLTLAPLRKWAAENPHFSKGYQAVKAVLYRIIRK